MPLNGEPGQRNQGFFVVGVRDGLQRFNREFRRFFVATPVCIRHRQPHQGPCSTPGILGYVLADSFSQLDASTTRRVGGTGLGLASVYGIMKNHDFPASTAKTGFCDHRISAIGPRQWNWNTDAIKEPV